MRPSAVLRVVVRRVQLGDVLVGEAARRLAPGPHRGRDVVGRDDLAGLGPLDLAGDVAGDRGVGEPGPAHQRGQDPRLARQDLRHRATHHARPEVAQLAQRRRVEGAGLHPLDPELDEPVPHLARGARGERDRERAPRVVLAGEGGVGDPVRDRAGLAGAGAREHHDRPADREGDLALLGIERGEHLLRRRRPAGRARGPQAVAGGGVGVGAAHGPILTPPSDPAHAVSALAHGPEAPDGWRPPAPGRPGGAGRGAEHHGTGDG